MIHTVKRYTFQATVTLAPPPAAGRRALPPPGQARRMTVRGRHHQTGRSQFFSAMLARNDQATPARKDAAILVTITITAEHAAGYFRPGSAFALWRDGDIGHGTVTRRLSWPVTAGT